MYDEIRVEVDMEQKMCNGCKKSSSEYYEMELQLRFTHFEDIMEVKAISMSILDNFNTINKLDEINNGFNVYFRDHGQMNKVFTLFRRKFKVLIEKRSNKLMGLDKMTSKNLYRHFQSIEIINLNKRDLVEVKGEQYRIKAINKGGQLVLLDESNGSKKIVTYEIVKDYFKLIEKKIKIE